MRGLRALALSMLILLGALTATATPAAAQTARMYGIGDSNYCMDVPNSDFRAGVNLVLWDCQGSQNQLFVFADDGHIVANAGQPNPQGVRMCVTGNGTGIELQACHRLTTGDRQWWFRTGEGFIRNNSRSPIECMAVPTTRYARLMPLTTGACYRSFLGPSLANWYPRPYSRDDERADTAQYQREQEPIQYSNSVANYDPEIRSRWEDMIARYGPQQKFSDQRTPFCLHRSPLLGQLVLGSCGDSWFEVNNIGQIAETGMVGGYPGVTGRCLADTGQGNTAAFQPCSSTNLRQRWWVFADSGQIQNQGSRLCLDIKNEARTENAPITTWPCGNRPPNQSFGIAKRSTFPKGGLGT